MKKFFLVAAMAVLGLSASAEVEPGFRMGVQANLGYTTLDTEAKGVSGSFGYGLGYILQYNVTSNFFLQSGIGFQNITHDEKEIKGTLNAVYAQLPIHVGYRFNLNSGTSLFLQAGPTFGLGILGSDIEYTVGSKKETTNYFDLAKRFDLGLGGRIGVEFSDIQISAGADYGVTNVFDGGGHNLNVNVGVAYMF